MLFFELSVLACQVTNLVESILVLHVEVFDFTQETCLQAKHLLLEFVGFLLQLGDLLVFQCDS